MRLATPPRCLLVGLAVAWASALPATAAADEPGAPKAARRVDFNRDIRPILSETCYACHGPDKNKREANLRLDTREGLLGDGEGGTVVPGQPDESELLWRILSDDPGEKMPPPKTGKTLTPAQVATIRAWIEQGAEWKGHWAYLPPTRPEVPAAEEPGFVRNPIDQFILARLREEGLGHAPEADRVTLIRRLSFDLVGLPPTKAEVDAFVADDRPDADDRLVSRLLDSPHFGERMAVAWLDLVRYADTIGYHSDNPMNVWPYRDYVIRSFNENVPFDRFTTEQLAGDLLPDAGIAQRVASGYNRLLQTTEEGGAQAKEYRAKYAADRVRNASTVWLGATMGCAECHDHKFDPFTQEDFYRFAAFFADIEEAAVGKREPGLPVPDARQAEALARLDDALTALRAMFDGDSPDLAAAQEAWEARHRGAVAWTVLDPFEVRVVGESTLRKQGGGVLKTAGKVAARETYTIRAQTDLKGITGLRLEALNDDDLPEGGPGTAQDGNFTLTGFSVTVAGAEEPVKLAGAVADFAQDGRPVAAALDGDDETGWSIAPAVDEPHAAVFEAAGPVAGTDLIVTLEFRSAAPQQAIGKLRLAVTTDPDPASAWVPPSVRASLAVPRDRRSHRQERAIAAYFRSTTPRLAAERDAFHALVREREALLRQSPRSLVATSGRPRVTRILPRGNWMDDSGPVVEPGAPRFLPHRDPSGRRATRLDLARWITARDNPLTARVFVNRLWRMYFGRGLSKVLDDLGAQGEWPTHPDLLDWLAVEFADSGWDVKHLVRLLVTSGAYRQSSQASSEQRERDPDNRLVGRQAPFRIDAEFVRDEALSIAGILSPTVGGPSVFPYQPAGYWDQLNFPRRVYQHDHGGRQYRRGLYVHRQRTFPHPSLLAFDAPSREECTAERPRSDIPQQALVLLNDPTYVEAARAFAERIVRDGGRSFRDRLAWAFGRALSRGPTEDESRALGRLFDRHLKQYADDRDAARQVVGVGEWPTPGDLDPAELAAWTSVARVLLNLHETITRS